MSDFILTQYFIALIATGIINFGLGLLVIFKGFNRRLNQILALYSLSLAVWSIFEALGITSTNESLALILWRLNHVGVIFIPVFLTHFIFLLVNIQGKKKKLIPISYAIATVFLFLNATPLLISEVVPKFSFNYFINPGPLYYIFLTQWIALAIYGNVELLKEFFRTTGYRKIQMKYFCWALLLSYIGGVPNFLPTFNLEISFIMPYATYAIPIYAIVTAYSIIKYQLMDIQIAATRAAILFIVYSLVLGFPFWLGYRYDLWQYSTWVMLIFATAGPFIFLYIQRKAEDHILQEERRIQGLITQAAYGMTSVKDLKKLLHLIQDIIKKSLGLNMVPIYLLDNERREFNLKIMDTSENDIDVIRIDEAFIKEMTSNEMPLVHEEIKVRSESDVKNDALKETLGMMTKLSANVIIPIAVNKNLLGFIILGERKSGKNYHKDLLEALTFFSDRAALAVEICYYMAEESKRIEQEGLRERVSSLDAMASSFAHEIDNPIQGMKGQIWCIEDALEREIGNISEESSENIKHGLEFITTNTNRISEMIKSILEYSRISTGELKSVSIYEVLEGFHNLMMPQIKRARIDFVEEIDQNLPSVLGDKIQLEEILMNFSTNSMHALNHTDDKKIVLKIFKKKPEIIRVEFSDNGYGIAKKLLKDIFLVSVTTKGSSEGTGLGLFRTRKIIDNHMGKIWAESQGEGKGSKFIFELPIEKKNK